MVNPKVPKRGGLFRPAEWSVSHSIEHEGVIFPTSDFSFTERSLGFGESISVNGAWGASKRGQFHVGFHFAFSWASFACLKGNRDETEIIIRGLHS